MFQLGAFNVVLCEEVVPISPVGGGLRSHNASIHELTEPRLR